MHYPRERAWWERLAWWRARRCASCGLRWPCTDAKVARVRATARVREDRTAAWAGPADTRGSMVGRAGFLTRLGQQRTQGGRR